MKQVLFLASLTILLLGECAMGETTYQTLIDSFAFKAEETFRDTKRVCTYFYENNVDWKTELPNLFTICAKASILHYLIWFKQTNSITPLSELLKNNENLRGAVANREYLNTLFKEIEEHFTFYSTIVEPLPSEVMDVYKRWHGKKITQSHLEDIARNLGKLQNLHGNMANQFEQEMNLVNEKMESFGHDSNQLTVLHDNLNEVNKKYTYMNVLKVLDSYVPTQKEILEHLTKASNTLNAYNAQRQLWAKFLMGKIKFTDLELMSGAAS